MSSPPPPPPPKKKNIYIVTQWKNGVTDTGNDM